MTTIATTRLSSKGQVVIPVRIRKQLRIESGAEFLVLRVGDDLLLKRIRRPARGRVRALAAKLRTQARRAGVKPADLGGAIRAARRG